MDEQKYPLLSRLGEPSDIQKLNIEALEALSAEARAFLMETIHKTGGHLGAALGVVELTVALFHQFDFQHDKIAWDVGHQAHVHKILTGRADRFSEYGQWDGLSKFLERSESSYDHVGAGHASTSISAATGLAVARDLAKEHHQVLAVIGDGSMTGGLAYEALSMAGHNELNMIVILNDNGMSIDPNVGPISRALTRLAASGSYNTVRDRVKDVIERIPFTSLFLKGLKHMERSVKDYASPNAAAFFESLNFRYFGPVSGHNLREIITLLEMAKTLKEPVLIHLSTVKGKGLGPELENTFEAHAVSPPATAGARSTPGKSWTNIFTEGMEEVMAKDPKVVAITAAMLSNTGLAPLQEKYPDRVLDVGIAEANAFCSASGLAIGGYKPFVTVYSTFSQRAFDQVIHDIALQNLPVRIMMDRGGFVGGDGPTHHGVFDFSYLRMIPNLVHMAPADELEMRRMLTTAQAYDGGPIAMRYPRGETPVMELPTSITPLPIGEAELRRTSDVPGLVLVAIGSMVATAMDAAAQLHEAGVPCSVINARYVKPLDKKLIASEITQAKGVITLEENVLAGGFGESILRLMADEDIRKPVKLLGVPDEFVGYGSQHQQLEAAGLTTAQVIETAKLLWRDIGEGKVALKKKPA